MSAVLSLAGLLSWSFAPDAAVISLECALECGRDKTYMVYAHSTNVNLLNSRPFKDIHRLAEVDRQKSGRVAFWVNEEPPQDLNIQDLSSA